MLFTFGVIALVSAVLASLNALDLKTNNRLLLGIQKLHRIFGMVAGSSAIVHLIIAVTTDQLRVTGFVALISLIGTSVFGILFAKLKIKWTFKVHKFLAIASLFAIAIHMIFNSSL